MIKTYHQIVEEMKKHRSKKHWSKKDLEKIMLAKMSGRWEEVYGSKLYNDYGGEFCSLLEVLHNVKEVKM
jgi:hypothetical protein